MRLCIPGTDERSLLLKEQCKGKGYIVTEMNPDAVVLALPKARYSDLKRCFREGQLFICGMVDEGIKEEAEEKNWQMKNVLEDEAFLLENARLTAEGAVYKAMCALKGAVSRKKCLVIGYGRIGKWLTRMLRGMGCNVTVCARREASRKMAGENSVDVHQMLEIVGEMDVIFNTVPAVVLTEKELKKVKRNTLLMELASAPYGMDMAAAEKLGLNVQIEGGLPGRYCPRDAAEIWLEYIERSVGT